MSYYPLGTSINLATVTQSLLAYTGSFPAFTTIPVTYADHALAVQTAPTNGVNGSPATTGSCTGSAPIGPTGPTGATGSKGTDVVSCPVGTIECSALHVSLSTHININVPSGSQYSIVCMEIPPGCDVGDVQCPPALPVAYPVIP